MANVFASDLEYVNTYSQSSEIQTFRDRSGSHPLDLRVNYSTSRYASSIDVGNDSTYDYTSFYREPRRAYSSYVNGNGAVSQVHDDQMRRWYREGDGVRKRFGWGPVGLADIFTQQVGNLVWWERDEYVYLQGVPVGAVHSSATTSAVAWWLSPDAMGTPRRTFVRGSALTQAQRLVMNPWGLGYVINDGSLASRPEMPFRLPGQIANTSDDLVDNGWRTYLPSMRQYLSPDPLHRSSVASGIGPQAYAYANGNPLKYSDPTGQTPQDVAKIISWARAGIQYLTNSGRRHEWSMWNNLSSHEPGASVYEYMTNVPSPNYMNCIEQNNWMYSWLDQQETFSPLQDPWLRYYRQSSVVGNILGHSWMVCRNAGECDQDERVLIDTWKGIVRQCSPNDPDCKAVMNQ